MLAAAVAVGLVAIAGGLVVFRARRRHERYLLGVVLEQVRREEEHHLAWRADQRLRACQQRLSRHLGEKAHGAAWEARIRAGLDEVTKAGAFKPKLVLAPPRRK